MFQAWEHTYVPTILMEKLFLAFSKNLNIVNSDVLIPPFFVLIVATSQNVLQVGIDKVCTNP